MPPQNQPLVLDLVKLVRWPVLAIVVMAIFYHPLYNTINSFPDVAENLSKFMLKARGFELSAEIQNHVLAAGNPQLVQAFKDLPTPALELLLNTGDREFETGVEGVNELLRDGGLQALLDRGLVAETGRSNGKVGFAPTRLGTKLYRIIIDTVVAKIAAQ